jgi:hypothetical protein
MSSEAVDVTHTTSCLPADLRLWAGAAVRLPAAGVHAHGGHPVVPLPGAAAGWVGVLAAMCARQLSIAKTLDSNMAPV